MEDFSEYFDLDCFLNETYQDEFEDLEDLVVYYGVF